MAFRNKDESNLDEMDPEQLISLKLNSKPHLHMDQKHQYSAPNPLKLSAGISHHEH